VPALRAGIVLQETDGVRVWLPEDRLSPADRKELVFWSTSPTQSPRSAFLDSVLVKALDLLHFDRLWPRLGLEPGMTCLEVGAGQGWASAMLQARVPGAEIHAADVAPDAIRCSSRWEAAFETRLAGRWAFPVGDAPFADAQFDRIFLFAALHHFGAANDFAAPLAELRRLLKPGGRIVAFNEPVSPPYLYARAFRRFNEERKNAQGADVDEDVLVMERLRRQAAAAGLDVAVEYEPVLIFKEHSWVGAVRSMIVRTFPFLNSRVSSGAHLTFTHRRSATAR
jgi:ubiquinone/menaquinone biosynthesis C-methylase UbiE